MRILTALGVVSATLWSAPSWADGLAPGTPLLPAYRNECGACHVAFPPRLLPAPSWQRLMAGLPRHFGADASLDAPLARELGAWLRTHASSGPRALAAPPQDRITRSEWFVHEHQELPAATWQRPAVGKPSNCAACHPRAADGRYGEHDIRIPR